MAALVLVDSPSYNIAMQLKIVSILIIAALFVIGTFSFFGLSMVDHSSGHNCPVNLLSGNSCPPVGGVLALALHHASGLQNLAKFTLNADALILLIVSAMAAAYLVYSKLSKNNISESASLYQGRLANANSYSIPFSQFLDWFSIHYKKDPHSYSLGV